MSDQLQAKAASQAICTLFDHRYLPRGLCMIASVRRNGGQQPIWVLCMSKACEDALRTLALDDVHILPLSELEHHIPALLGIKPGRKPLEYYFTCMAALHRYILDTAPWVDCTMYVDADIAFFDNPDIVFDAIGDAPAAITPHQFPSAIAAGLEKFGLYNAGWTAFRRTPEGEGLLNWWLARSIDWCFDYIDGSHYANQGYLMEFQNITPNTRILRQKGFNCAPWNIGGYRFTEENDLLTVDGERLVFFHFHGVKRHYGIFYFDCHRDYRTAMPRLVRNRLYRPYIRELVAREQDMQPVLADAASQTPLSRIRRASGFKLANLRLWMAGARGTVAGFVKRAMDVADGRPILVCGRRVW